MTNLDPARIEEFLSRRKRVLIDDPSLARAGVLLLLYYRNDELHVLLTRRTVDVEHHKGQISFPGGSEDPADTDIVRTALRETEEETGLAADKVRILGLFDDAWTPSGFRITPVIGFLSALPELKVNPREVEAIIEVPLSFFLDAKNEKKKSMTRNGRTVDVYFYQYGKNEIWGATAGMLRSFLVSFRDERSA